VSGSLQHHLPDGSLYHEFRYNVVKLWERPVDDILAGDLATLPLAPVSRVPAGELPRIIRRMDERIEREASTDERPDLWTAAFLLMGLIYPEHLARTLLQGKSYMRDSTTYQAILREGEAKGKAEGKAEGIAQGKAEEARGLVLRLGRKQFGPPAPQFEAKIQAMTDVEKLEELSERVLDVSSWDELIDES
jgi:predicted transposase YdaD